MLKNLWNQLVRSGCAAGDQVKRQAPNVHAYVHHIYSIEFPHWTPIYLRYRAPIQRKARYLFWKHARFRIIESTFQMFFFSLRPNLGWKFLGRDSDIWNFQSTYIMIKARFFLICLTFPPPPVFIVYLREKHSFARNGQHPMWLENAYYYYSNFKIENNKSTFYRFPLQIVYGT